MWHSVRNREPNDDCKAVGGDTAACIWWTKSKCGWKETQAVENRGLDYDRMSEE